MPSIGSRRWPFTAYWTTRALFLILLTGAGAVFGGVLLICKPDDFHRMEENGITSTVFGSGLILFSSFALYRTYKKYKIDEDRPSSNEGPRAEIRQMETFATGQHQTFQHYHLPGHQADTSNTPPVHEHIPHTVNSNRDISSYSFLPSYEDAVRYYQEINGHLYT